MAAPPSSVVTVDPDGDLVLLLELIPIHKSDESSSESQINDSYGNFFSPETANSPGDTQHECPEQYKSKILVSSKHMSFASPVFKAMLTGDFKEAVELREKGKTEIPLPDDDADAMLVLSMEFAVKVWTANHSPLYWDRSWYNTACWICVTWVFRLDDEFTEATEKLIRESGVGLGAILKENDLALPIPEKVINKIDESRENAVSQLIKVLKDTISKYQGQTLICPSHSMRYVLDVISHRETCDATVIGSLIKSAAKKGLFPFPETPFKSPLQYCVVKGRLETLKAQTACNVVVQDESLHHDVLEMIQRSIESVDDDISGLSLEDCK